MIVKSWQGREDDLGTRLFYFGVFGYWNPVRIVSYSWFCWLNYLFIHKIVFLTCGLIVALLVDLIRYLWEYLTMFKKMGRVVSHSTSKGEKDTKFLSKGLQH